MNTFDWHLRAKCHDSDGEDGNAPVLAGVVRGGLEEGEADHGDGGGDGEGGDPAQQQPHQPSESQQHLIVQIIDLLFCLFLYLKKGGDCDCSLDLPHSPLPDLRPLFHTVDRVHISQISLHQIHWAVGRIVYNRAIKWESQ